MNMNYLSGLRYGIGLDIGISSVGWAIVALNELDEPCGLADIGARIFDAAEHPKNGASLAAPRRLARGARRRIRRRAHRKERIRALILQSGLLPQSQLDSLFQKKQLEDIYMVRARGLDMTLTPEEFARVLIHLSQRRGFKSNRKGEDKEGDNGKLLKAVDENRKRMAQGGYRSAGEMFAKDAFYVEHKRNQGGKYLSTIHRDMVADEARLLFQKQRALGQAFASAAFEENYLGLLLSQRAFDEGPGGDSPYGGNQVNKMRGNCQFFKEEPRAPKAALSFERFRFWEKINHLRIQSLTDSRTLTRDEKAAVYQEAVKREGLSYSDVRSMLGLSDEERFNSLTYTAKKGMQTEWAALALPERNKQIEEKKVGQFKAWHTLRKALDKADKNKINDLDDITLDAITEILTLYKQDDSILENLKALDLSPEIAESLMNVTPFSGFAHLSVKACRVLLPHLETGMNYDAACTAAGLDFRGHESKPQLTLPAETDDMEQITSPVVRRAVSQTIKVVNAIVRMMGNSPVFVKVELAREMAKNFDERREMKQGMEENAERNERIMERLRQEFHVMNPTGLDLVKLKLYEEQQCKCTYTLEPFDIRRLFEKGYAEIDHIIPYSISFDDSYANKALVHAKANRDKGNRLPLQYLAGEARERYIVYTANAPYRARKRLNLLKKEITQEDERQFKERNLQDTKHMSRFIYNYMNDYLRFEPFLSGRKKHVTAVSGSITSHLRKR